MKLTPLVLAACAAACMTPQLAASDDVTATEPLIPPLFTVDAASPEVLDGFLEPGDLLLPPGPNIPTIEVGRGNLGLTDIFDNVDALALGATNVTAIDTFVMIFSVDRASVGGAAPDPNIAAMGFPFNVQDQANKNQAASDAFMSLLLFNRNGFIPPNKLSPRGSAVSNNVLVINGGDAGGVDFNVSPTGLSPTASNGGSQSDVDGGGGTQSSSPAPAASRAPGDWPQPFVFFSLSAGSPSLGTLPGTGSPADIYIDFDPNSPSGQELYVGPGALGLQPGDDINALIIFESGDNNFTSGEDQVVFSLAPGSPSLDSNFGPGDLLTSNGFGSFGPYAPASSLGLADVDNLNMLDFVFCDNVLDCVGRWAIGFVENPCPGDLDGDLDVDLADLGILLSAYGSCAGDPDYIPLADFDHNGCIDISDLGVLLANYGMVC